MRFNGYMLIDMKSPTIVAPTDIPLKQAEAIPARPTASRPWPHRINKAADLPPQSRDYVPCNDEPQCLSFQELNRMRTDLET